MDRYIILDIPCIFFIKQLKKVFNCPNSEILSLIRIFSSIEEYEYVTKYIVNGIADDNVDEFIYALSKIDTFNELTTELNEYYNHLCLREKRDNCMIYLLNKDTIIVRKDNPFLI